MRPRYQQGQICHGGSNWVLRYHEDRAGVDGRVKRVRTMSTLAPFAEHPYKGSPADLDKLRELFHDKITAILAPINRENPTVKAAFKLGSLSNRIIFSAWNTDSASLRIMNCISSRRPLRLPRHLEGPRRR